MRILIALDGTPLGESAVVAVEQLAVSADAAVHLFTVIHPDDAEETFMPASEPSTSGDVAGGETLRTSEPQAQTGDEELDASRRARTEAERFLRGVAELHLPGHNVEVSSEVARNPADAIVYRAGEVSADFIAMGTRGRGGIGRALLGSVAEKVVREAGVPVLLVGPRMRSALADMRQEEQEEQAPPEERAVSSPDDETAARDIKTVPTQTLIDWLASADWQLRRQAKEELSARGQDVVVDLHDAMKSRNDNVRWGAVKVLHDIRDERSIPVLIDALEDRNPTIRWASAEALTDIGNPVVLPILRRLLTNSGSVWLQEGAHHVLQRMVDPTISPVVNALEGPYPSITVPPRVHEALKSLEGFA